jgi:serine/threonine-protein kinase RsbW
MTDSPSFETAAGCKNLPAQGNQPIVTAAARERIAMISTVPRLFPKEGQEQSSSRGWLQRHALSTAELLPIIDEIISALATAHFSAKEIFGIRLALEEAGVNAIKHGHQGRQDRPVFIRYQLSADQILVEVEDQGPGFDPERVPDPLAPENLERPCGRGLLLMKCYTTWISYNQRGNCVTLCKKHSE